jgi:hypothetical protein
MIIRAIPMISTACHHRYSLGHHPHPCGAGALLIPTITGTKRLHLAWLPKNALQNLAVSESQLTRNKILAHLKNFSTTLTILYPAN